MENKSDFVVDQLADELNGLLASWRAIRIDFVGASPGPLLSEQDWNESTNLRRIVKAIDAQQDAANSRDFACAWHEAVSLARTVIYDGLVPWADRVVHVFGLTSFPAEVPDPPQDFPRSPTGANSGILATAVGTPDSVEAGRRIIFWAAAHVDPAARRRCEDHCYLFWRWTGQILDWHESTVVATMPLMAAVKAAFDFLRSNHISTSCADPCEMPKPAERHSIRKITSNQFFIVFGEEIGEIKGVGAERLVRLCRERNVALAVLAGELPCFEGSNSVVSQEEMPTAQGIARISEAQEIGKDDVRRLRKHLGEVREDIVLRLSAEPSAEEQERLEEQLKQVKRQQNALPRIPDSNVRRMRDSVEQSLRRLEKQLQRKMPKFSAYTAKCWKFDELANRYRYLDIDGINWDFADF